jgi:hypothetical protein
VEKYGAISNDAQRKNIVSIGNLAKAIKAKWNLAAPLHLGIAPQNTPSPYVAFFFVGGIPLDTMNTRMDDVRVQFSLFSKERSSEEVWGLYTALEILFDYCKLEVEDAGFVEMRRLSVPTLMREPVDNWWHLRVDYKVVLYKGEVQEADMGDWQESVLTKSLNTPPESLTSGDRYLIASGATDAWSGHDNQIATWNGVKWLFAIPSKGMTVWVEDEEIDYVWKE